MKVDENKAHNWVNLLFDFENEKNAASCFSYFTLTENDICTNTWHIHNRQKYLSWLRISFEYFVYFKKHLKDCSGIGISRPFRILNISEKTVFLQEFYKNVEITCFLNRVASW